MTTSANRFSSIPGRFYTFHATSTTRELPKSEHLEERVTPPSKEGHSRFSARFFQQLRQAWNVLTSMRTALVLLFCWAVAAAPGTIFPQRTLNPEKVTAYYADHPTLAPIVDRLWGFDVFAAPWFAAIYLLLFISLIGCLASRIPTYFRNLTAGPPAAPARLDRLPDSADLGGFKSTPDRLAKQVEEAWRKARWRPVVSHSQGVWTLSAQRGQLKEAGNIVFHLSLVAVLIGVAVGALYGFTGGMIITEGSTVCHTRQAYDQFTPGRLVNAADLPPFCVTLTNFTGKYTPKGEPLGYTADTYYREGNEAATEPPKDPFELAVNKPLRMDGAAVYLLNHGYAPILRYTDRFGTVFESPSTFLPKDSRLTSEGVVVLPEANQDPASATRARGVEVAFEGLYMPTVPPIGFSTQSAHPARHDEGIVLVAYRGDTGLNTGIPRSVYTLDQKQIASKKLQAVGSTFLRPGEKWSLDDGTTVEFVRSVEWMAVNVAHDPGKILTLSGAGGMVLGLIVTLFTRRRRVFARLTQNNDGTTVTMGGLMRSGSMKSEFDRLVGATSTQCKQIDRKENS